MNLSSANPRFVCKKMSALFGSSDFDDGGAMPKGGDPELQDFLMREKQRAQFNAQVIVLIFSFSVKCFFRFTS